MCPIIFDLEPTDLQGPLAQFQITRFLKGDIWKLFKTINSLAAENKLADGVAEGVFNKWWPDLELDLKAILDGHIAKSDVKKIRSDRELIEEILLLSRNQIAEKEKVPLRIPTQKYVGSINEQFIDIFKFVVDDTGFLNDTELRKRLLNLHTIISKRMIDGEIREALLVELESLTARLKPPLRKATKSADMDDDIPF